MLLGDSETDSLLPKKVTRKILKGMNRVAKARSNGISDLNKSCGLRKFILEPTSGAEVLTIKISFKHTETQVFSRRKLIL